MISLKVLSAAAALALALPAVVPTASLAQVPPHRGPGGPGGAGGPGGRPAGAPVARAPITGAPVAGGGPRVYGGGGRYDFGHEHHHHDGGFIPGAVAGALIGGAIASQGPYYARTPYYNGSPSYYGGDDYSDGPVVQVAPDTGGDDVAYCMQTYRSYDPQSGTYVGFDGYRHPCP
jgi:BA14K-like protein